MARLVVVVLAAGLTWSAAGIASANSNVTTANCTDGLSFVMLRGEAGTVVTATLDGELVRGPFTIATQGDPLAFTSPNPDPTRPHTWVVVVDSVWNADQTITRSVAPCVTPTTVPPTTQATTTTTVPPTTTVAVTTPPVPTTTVVTPPVPTTTVVTPPRATTTTAPATTTTGTFRLPDTAQNHGDELAIGLASLAAGFGCIVAARRKRSAS